VIVGELRSFLGLTGYYRLFINHFPYISVLLYNLVNNSIRLQKIFCLEKIHKKNFDNIKDSLIPLPILAMIDPEVDFIQQIYALNYTIGIVLVRCQLWK
jgi:hypothetical protein